VRSDQKFDILITLIIIGGILTAGWFMGSAIHQSAAQGQKFQVECLEKGGEIKYIDRVGERCTKK
jgi:hypothetical protein